MYTYNENRPHPVSCVFRAVFRLGGDKKEKSSKMCIYSSSFFSFFFFFFSFYFVLNFVFYLVASENCRRWGEIDPPLSTQTSPKYWYRGVVSRGAEAYESVCVESSENGEDGVHLGLSDPDGPPPGRPSREHRCSSQAGNSYSLWYVQQRLKKLSMITNAKILNLDPDFTSLNGCYHILV